jgi:hypothetical protein
MVKFFRNKSPYIHELLLSLQLCPGGEPACRQAGLVDSKGKKSYDL